MKKWSQRNVVIWCALCLLLVGHSAAQQASASQSGDGQAASAIVPRLVRFSGIVKDDAGNPRTGITGITFALYKDQSGGTALWLETQNVTLDAQGRYTVLLGSNSAEGVTPELFSANQAQWLGVQPEGLPEQRILLASVPYALKAADAETLGGMPASSFVLAAPVAAAGSGSAGSQTAGSGANNVNPGAVPNTITGTTNYIPVYTSDAGDQGNSVLYQQPTTNYLGFQTTNPQYNFQLVVPGEDWLYGGFSIVPAFSGGTNWNTLYGNGGSGFSLIGTAKNMGYPASRLDMGANATINFQTGNGSAVPTSRMFVTAAGNVGIGTVAPAANLEIAGTVGLLVDSPGTITGTIVGNGSGLTSLPAASLTGTLPTAALSGVNGSGLISLNAASLTTGTLPSTALPGNVALVNAANMFTTSQAISAAGTGLSIASSGSGSTALSVQATDTTTSNIAISGAADGLDGTGVYGQAGSGSNAYGVWGLSSTGYAGQFSGNVNITGTLTGAAESLRIDHPLDPADKYLYHASVESSEMMNIYTGNAVLDESGAGVVQLPSWFEALNTDFRYQLTAVGGPGPGLYVAQEIQNNSFRIAGGTSGLKVSWQVTGVRQDAFARANPLVVEVEKSERERGYYIHPQLFGQSPEKSIEWAQHPLQMKMEQQRQAAEKPK